MATFLQLTLLVANGLIQYREELKLFISIHNIHVMLISETHFPEKSYLKLPRYTVYDTSHPVRTSRGVTAKIIIIIIIIIIIAVFKV
jgi:hypothetical protein